MTGSPQARGRRRATHPQQSKQVQNQAVAQIHKGLHHTRWGETWQSTQQPHKAEPHDSTPRGTGSTRSHTDWAKLLWPANQRSQNSDSHHHSRSNSRETKQFHTGTLTTTTNPRPQGREHSRHRTTSQQTAQPQRGAATTATTTATHAVGTQQRTTTNPPHHRPRSHTENCAANT